MPSTKLAIAITVTLALSFAPLAHAECTKDVECKGTRICVDGACVESPAPIAQVVPTATVPEPATPARPRFVRRSKELFVAGIVTLSLVPIGIMVTAVSLFNKSSCQDTADFDATTNPHALESANCNRHDIGIYAGAASSVLLLGGGLTMLLYGVKRVPVDEQTTRIRPWFSNKTAGLGFETSF